MHPAVEFHENLADAWDHKYKKGTFEKRVRVTESLLGGLRHIRGKWLDAGCGTGTLSRLLAECGCDVCGVDASEAMVRQAERLGRGRGGNVRFEVVETIEKLPFERETFRGILCSSVLEYLDEPATCLREFWRVLEKGGLLVVSVPNRRSILRIAENVCFRLTGLLSSNPRPTYLAFSAHEFTAGDFSALLQQEHFRMLRYAFCGSPLGGVIDRSSRVGSLLFALAEKVPSARPPR